MGRAAHACMWPRRRRHAPLHRWRRGCRALSVRGRVVGAWQGCGAASPGPPWAPWARPVLQAPPSPHASLGGHGAKQRPGNPSPSNPPHVLMQACLPVTRMNPAVSAAASLPAHHPPGPAQRASIRCTCTHELDRLGTAPATPTPAPASVRRASSPTIRSDRTSSTTPTCTQPARARPGGWCSPPAAWCAPWVT